jgi:hypothetical protein
MKFFAKGRTSCVTEERTEEQVKREIIETMQCDMGIVFGEGMSDSEIEEAVTEHNDITDYLDEGTFDGINYEITTAV